MLERKLSSEPNLCGIFDFCDHFVNTEEGGGGIIFLNGEFVLDDTPDDVDEEIL